MVKSWTGSHVIGAPATVRARLDELVERTAVDELMVTTMVHAHDRRRRVLPAARRGVGTARRGPVTDGGG